MTNALTQVTSPLGSALKWTAALGLLRRRRRGLRGRAGLLSGGALLALAGAVLLTTNKGRALRTRWGSQVGALLGRQLGRQAGSQPIQTARLARSAAKLVSSNAE
jgi:hypothetical protein